MKTIDVITRLKGVLNPYSYPGENLKALFDLPITEALKKAEEAIRAMRKKQSLNEEVTGVFGTL